MLKLEQHFNQLVDASKKIVTNKYALATGATFLTSALLLKLIIKYKRAAKRKTYPRDVVILHQFPRGLRAPSSSSFALKLETWLRMANIKYQNEHGYEFSSKGKVPFITFNGEDIADSQFCIEFLSKKFNVNFASNFSAAENGIARAFLKMTEESLFWNVVLNRFVYEQDPQSAGIPSIAYFYYKSAISKRSKAQGYGLHSFDEMQSIGRADLDAINSFIGNKKFLLGDKVCDADAALFGMLAQIWCHDRKTLYNYLVENCSNIMRYVNNMKETYWLDWNQVVLGNQL